MLFRSRTPVEPRGERGQLPIVHLNLLPLVIFVHLNFALHINKKVSLLLMKAHVHVTHCFFCHFITETKFSDSSKKKKVQWVPLETQSFVRTTVLAILTFLTAIHLYITFFRNLTYTIFIRTNFTTVEFLRCLNLLLTLFYCLLFTTCQLSDC